MASKRTAPGKRTPLAAGAQRRPRGSEEFGHVGREAPFYPPCPTPSSPSHSLSHSPPEPNPPHAVPRNKTITRRRPETRAAPAITEASGRAAQVCPNKGTGNAVSWNTCRSSGRECRCRRRLQMSPASEGAAGHVSRWVVVLLDQFAGVSWRCVHTCDLWVWTAHA